MINGEIDKRLLDQVHAIERLLEERKGLNDDIKDRFALLKAEGHHVPTIKWGIQQRAIEAEKRREQEALRETYSAQLGLDF